LTAKASNKAARYAPSKEKSDRILNNGTWRFEPQSFGPSL
jgi:hypothetical protein